MDQIILINVD